MKHVTDIRDIMTYNPAFCTPLQTLREAAQMMLDNDCGEIPVVSDRHDRHPVAVITDRDIVIRAVAKGLNPQDLHVRDCMTGPCLTVPLEASIEDCIETLEQNKIRRLPVVDGDGFLCGIISQADLVRIADDTETADMIQKISEPQGQSPRRKWQ